ncbi:hypothetical protein RlegTA1_09120 [Rhizobium ruizarguesonis]|nr:hypothetical protein [Rhizobium ruizarguesonis]UFW96194.1 hypothetical protein RlegTA1_09120 [Rhizobium ruizarguesonis]
MASVIVPPRCPSVAEGVVQACTFMPNVPFGPILLEGSIAARRLAKVSGFSDRSSVPGVGHTEDEDSFTLMARADFCRREQSSLHLEAKLPKVSVNPFRSSDFVSACGKHPGDVFNEDEPCAGSDDDATGVRPEVALVVLPLLAAGEAMRLARDAANEAVHCATPCAAVEGSGIAPYRRWSHEARFHS